MAAAFRVGGGRCKGVVAPCGAMFGMEVGHGTRWYALESSIRKSRAYDVAYFSDVFTPPTWAAFLADGGRVTAFSGGAMLRRAHAVNPGDRLICYLKGKFSFVGALEATSTAYTSEEPIWDHQDFPTRVDVRPLALFPIEQSLPLSDLEGKLSFYPEGTPRSLVPAYFQGSPRRLPDRDGEALWRAILAHEDGVKSVATPLPNQVASALEIPTAHTEAQRLLVEFGLAVGVDVWIPRADRGAVGRSDSRLDLNRLLPELPFLFPGKAQSVIQNIDAIWLKGSTVVAVFEVENTTSIYSGLLRMSDLVALVPNARFPMFIVAPAQRRSAVRDEVLRPTFSALPTPLHQLCGFISIEALQERRKTLGDELLKYLLPGFVNDLAEHFTD